MKSILLCCLIAFPAAAFAQGPLAPPSTVDPATGPVPPLNGGTPQATMKTLHQVEPRTPVQALSATPPYNITQPGSYYLTSNINVASGNAIVISSDDVSLDLNGFTISSNQASVGGLAAILISSSHSRLMVRNGSIKSGTIVPAAGAPTAVGFSNGIYCTGTLSQALVSDMHLTGIAGTAVYLDAGGIIERCSASNCGTGFRADEIRGCRAIQCYNTGIYALANATQCYGESTDGTGIFAGANVRDCKGVSTGGIGLQVDGNAENCIGTSAGTIDTDDGIKVSGNATNCRGTANAGSGIHVSCNAANCTGFANSGIGVNVGANAIGCNGTSLMATGLQVAGNAENCAGKSTGNSLTAYGILVAVNAANCSGTASDGTGLIVAGNAIGCSGKTQGTTASSYGLRCNQTANSCYGAASGGGSSVGLSAGIAIGCTYVGTLSVPAGKTFNM